MFTAKGETLFLGTNMGCVMHCEACVIIFIIPIFLNKNIGVNLRKVG